MKDNVSDLAQKIVAQIFGAKSFENLRGADGIPKQLVPLLTEFAAQVHAEALQLCIDKLENSQVASPASNSGISLGPYTTPLAILIETIRALLPADAAALAAKRESELIQKGRLAELKLTRACASEMTYKELSEWFTQRCAEL